ncbi:MAG: hypothetical protein F6K54_28115 [Okeania sp. SIO3B5]|uniref:hypothetical protein n=1 Tax=Okeania sp. SIO3B5 TaxID=2607811 RepID=UPI001401A890|nr:hypothetical protein [Okeania sp. SIO3B5]NEO56601.1 hypothetical protein [Okeania sp. SIO3B5]
MPIELPNLDDRTYDNLVQEALSMIPTYAPEWTNHNPSDPGITLIELFAYLTEMLLYRQNRITDDNLRMFLKLLNGPSWEQTRDLREEVELAVLGVRQRYRAVTCEDFEELAKEADARKEADSRIARAHCVPKRNLESDPLDQSGESPGHISVIIVPGIAIAPQIFFFDGTYTDYTQTTQVNNETPLALNSAPEHFLYLGLTTTFRSVEFRFGTPGTNYQLKIEYFNGLEWVEMTVERHSLTEQTSNWNENGLIQFNIPDNWEQIDINGTTGYWLRVSTETNPSQVAQVLRIQIQHNLKQVVKNYLEPRRLLTTAVHVVEPRYVKIRVQLTVVMKQDAPEAEVQSKAFKTLQDFFDPLKGGTEGKGWPFGRNVYISEIYELLDSVSGVDYVKKTQEVETQEELDEVQLIDELASGESERLIRNVNGELIGIQIKSHELVEAEIDLIVE